MRWTTMVAGVLLVTAPGCDGDDDTPWANRARQVVSGPATLIGFGDRACTTSARPSRWCGFFRPAPDEPERTELWVLDVTRALAGERLPCDGTSSGCRLMTDELWTGLKIESPSHPEAHRFDGDTLLFLADPSPTTEQLDRYEGKVWAWRPGWAKPRPLTSGRGVLCDGNRDGTAAWCVDGVSDRPLGFDLRAGLIRDADDSLLPTVERIVPVRAGQRVWSVAFAPAGDPLLYSNWRDDEQAETLRVLPLGGGAAPRAVLEGATAWQLSSDGGSVYFLKDAVRARGDVSFTLAAATLPAPGAPAARRDIASGVFDYQPLGAAGKPDVGVAFMTEPRGMEGLLSLARPGAAPTMIAPDVHFWRSSADGRFLYILQVDRAGERGLLADVERGALCRLGTRPDITVYSISFLPSLGLVSWPEQAADDDEEDPMEMLGRAGDCSGARPLGRLKYLAPVGARGLVLGEGPDSNLALSFLPLPGGQPDEARRQPLLGAVDRDNIAPVGPEPEALLVGTRETAPAGKGLVLVPLR